DDQACGGFGVAFAAGGVLADVQADQDGFLVEGADEAGAGGGGGEPAVGASRRAWPTAARRGGGGAGGGGGGRPPLEGGVAVGRSVAVSGWWAGMRARWRGPAVA